MAEAFISGRSRDTARALIAAAEEAGVDPQRIRTSSQPAGYFVPNKVAKAYQAANGAPETDSTDADVDSTAPDSDSTTPDSDSTGAAADTDDADSTTGGDGTQEPEKQEEPASEVKDAAPSEDDGVDPQPPGNASQAAWADWARRNKGYDESEGLTRDQLKTRFGA